MNKKCFKCRKIKPIDDFYQHKLMSDGHLGKCKSCTKTDERRRYHDPVNRDRIIAYERARAQNEHRKAKCLEYQRRMRLRYPGKYKARSKVANALKYGLLTRLPCKECGALDTEAHHTDYRKPLEVTWLCRPHHMAIEGKKTYLT